MPEWLIFLIRKIPYVRKIEMELKGACEYHEHYSTSIDKALKQPRNGTELLDCHLKEIHRLHGVQ